MIPLPSLALLTTDSPRRNQRWQDRQRILSAGRKSRGGLGFCDSVANRSAAWTRTLGRWLRYWHRGQLGGRVRRRTFATAFEEERRGGELDERAEHE